MSTFTRGSITIHHHKITIKHHCSLYSKVIGKPIKHLAWIQLYLLHHITIRSCLAKAWVLDFAGFGLVDCNPKVAVPRRQTNVETMDTGGKTGGKSSWKSGQI